MIITISGTVGSGKTTIAQLLAQKLGYKHYSMGDLSRTLAQKKGMSIEEYNEWGKTHPERDTEIDEYQKKLGEDEDNFVIDGRLSWHFIPESVKLFVDATLEVRAKRRQGEPRDTESYTSAEEATQKILERDASDKARYQERYGIDPSDTRHYDLVIDSSHVAPEVIVADILEFIGDMAP